MKKQEYNVDDILKEIKEKKAKQLGAAVPPTPSSSEPQSRRQKPVTGSSKEEQELFFSNLAARREEERVREIERLRLAEEQRVKREEERFKELQEQARLRTKKQAEEQQAREKAIHATMASNLEKAAAAKPVEKQPAESKVPDIKPLETRPEAPKPAEEKIPEAEMSFNGFEPLITKPEKGAAPEEILNPEKPKKSKFNFFHRKEEEKPLEKAEPKAEKPQQKPESKPEAPASAKASGPSLFDISAFDADSSIKPKKSDKKEKSGSYLLSAPEETAPKAKAPEKKSAELEAPKHSEKSSVKTAEKPEEKSSEQDFLITEARHIEPKKKKKVPAAKQSKPVKETPKEVPAKASEKVSEKLSEKAPAKIPEPKAEETHSSNSELSDYTSPKDKDSILHDIHATKIGLIVRSVLMFILFVISLYLSLAARDIQIRGELLPLPVFIQPERDLRAYMAFSCLLTGIGALICSNTVGGGLIALMKMKANTDTLPMLAVLGTLAQGICFIVKPELFSVNKADFGSNLYLFFPVAQLILFFNLIGKILIISRVQNNFSVVSSDRPKHAAMFLKDRTLLRELSKDLPMEAYTIAYPENTKLLAGFLDNSYSDDYAEAMNHILAPICLVGGLLMSLLSYLFNKNAAEAVTTFTAIMCICAPLTSTIAANLPLYRMSQRLTPSGTMVSGYSAVETFASTEGVIFNDRDLFHPSDVLLHGIRPFDQGQIDSVILDAASVVCNTRSMLSDIFTKIIGSDRSMLRPVENLVTEDSLGISAWVDGKRVLIGNRQMMLNHGIEIPSTDCETRFVRENKNIVYLANSGQLSAMFVVRYRANESVKKQLDELAKRKICLIINSSDPNITAQQIHNVYDYPLELINMIPVNLHTSYRQLTASRDSSPAKLGFLGSTKQMVNAIFDCMYTKTAIDRAVLIQMISIVIGYGLVALFALMGNLSSLSVGHLIFFQLAWMLIGIIFPNLRKHN